MVLRKTSFILLPFLFVLVATPLAGCLSKNKEVVRAPTPMSIAVAGVLGFADRRDVEALPQDLVDRIGTLLESRNLQPRAVPPTTYTEVFQRRRATPHRLAHLVENTSDTELIFLVETEPRFYSQLSGRYRWTVSMALTLAPRGSPEEAVTSEVKVPVFLQFYHQKEHAAIEAATPLVERHVGYLLDEYLGGLARVAVDREPAG